MDKTTNRDRTTVNKIDNEKGVRTWMPFAATAVVFPKLETNVIFQRRVMLAASSRLGKSNCCHAFFSRSSLFSLFRLLWLQVATAVVMRPADAAGNRAGERHAEKRDRRGQKRDRQE